MSFYYLECVVKGPVVDVEEALCQAHHRTEPVTPHHLLCQVRAPGLACHPCTHKKKKRKETDDDYKKFFLQSRTSEMFSQEQFNWQAVTLWTAEEL